MQPSNPPAREQRLSPYYVGLAVTSLVAVSTGAADNLPDFETGHEDRLGLSFAPDGTAAYWSAWNGRWGGDKSAQLIFVSARGGDGWSKPAPMPFSGEHADSDPFVSPDGQWLYFVSQRPTSEDDTDYDRNLWRYSLEAKGPPELLSINSGAAEYSPVVTTSGALYFASNRGDDPANGNLYRAASKGDQFDTPEPLGPALNSRTGEWNLWVSPDDDEVLFEASSRPTNVSVPGDLYYSWRSDAGWTAAVPVAALNTRNSDLMPRLSPDGRTLHYTTAPIGGHATFATVPWPALRDALRNDYVPVLLVANRSSHEVTFVDVGRGVIVQRVATGEGPHLLSNVSKGRLLATGYGEFPRPHADPVKQRPPFMAVPNSRLSLIDTASRRVLKETRLDDCARPHASWIVGSRGYVTCERERQVHEVDLATLETLRRFDTQQAGSHVLAFDSASRTLVTANVDAGSITLLGLDDSRSQVVALAPGSEGSLAVDGRVWVANGTDGSVSVVDPVTGTIVEHREDVCSFPIAFSADAFGKIWLACFASAELVAFDRTDATEARRIRLADQPLNVLAHPGRDLIYVSLPRQNAVAEIDIPSGSELRRIRVGIEPDGLRWAQHSD